MINKQDHCLLTAAGITLVGMLYVEGYLERSSVTTSE